MSGASPSGRFPPSQRVRKRAEFKTIQAQARRVHTAHFVLLVYSRCEAGDPSAPAPRLGVTASRRIGPAVVRNRAKRLVREAFRATRALWQPGIDLVVIVRRPLGDMKLDAVVREWTAQTRKIGDHTQNARGDYRLRSSELPT